MYNSIIFVWLESLLIISYDSYWGENGFFRLIRGINNLMIESHCSGVEIDISDEELVWSKKPHYGGSLWGLVPFSKEVEAHPVHLEVDDVTSQQYEQVTVDGISSLKSILSIVTIACCLGIVLGVSLNRSIRYIS